MRLPRTTLAAILLSASLPIASAQPGALDPSFGTGGISLGGAPSFARDVALDHNGRVVFVGARSDSNDDPDEPLVGRLLPDGSIDTSFDSEGVRPIPNACRFPARTVLEAVDVTDHLDIIAAGTNGCRRGVVVRLLERGSPDHGFGDAGVFIYNPDSDSRSSIFHGIDVAANGSVVAVGREVRQTPGGGVRTFLLVLRLTAEGDPDPSFGTNGVVRLPVSDDLLPDSQLNDLVIYPDGRVLATGYALLGGSYQSVVARLNADGTPDATFEGGGLVVHDFGDGVADVANALTYGPDGAIYIAGTVFSGNTFTFFGARLRFDGTRDPMYGVNGVAVIQATPGSSCVARDLILDLSERLVLVGDCTEGPSETWALARLIPGGGVDSSFGDDGIARPPGPGTSRNLFGIARQGDGRLVVAGSAVIDGMIVWAVARILDDAVMEADPRSSDPLVVTVSPNPVQALAYLRFSLDDLGGATVTLYDALGRVALRVDMGQLPAGTHVQPLDVTSLAPGVYLLQWQSGARVTTQAVSVR
jgi:uncharacterized delta-60 repeat protein